MKSSAAQSVKGYLEKYICVNSFKMKNNKHKDRELARTCLSVAYDVTHHMNHLIQSNNANDFEAIKTCLRQNVAIIHQTLRSQQSKLAGWFSKTSLPTDFGKCIHAAWSSLQEHEREDEEVSP
jgi:hypothetical protein